MSSGRPKKILVVKISSLGDVIHTFPAVEVLKNELGAEMDWLVHPSFAEALDYCPGISRKILFPRKELGSMKSFPSSFFRLLKELRKSEYDAVIDFQGLIRSAFFSRLSRAPIIAGFANPREKAAALFYNRRIGMEIGTSHAVEKNIRLVSSLFQISAKFPHRPAPVNDLHSSRAKIILKEAGLPESAPYLCIAPGARWFSKQWPPEFFASVLEKLAPICPKHHFLILASAADAKYSRIISSQFKSERLIDLSGKTGIGELFEIIRGAGALLANDSGPIHIASELEIPTVALFGPSDPEKTAPYGKIHDVLQPHLDCIVCLSHYCPRETYDCHKAIRPEEVAERLAEKILRKNAPH